MNLYVISSLSDVGGGLAFCFVLRHAADGLKRCGQFRRLSCRARGAAGGWPFLADVQSRLDFENVAHARRSNRSKRWAQIGNSGIIPRIAGTTRIGLWRVPVAAWIFQLAVAAATALPPRSVGTAPRAATAVFTARARALVELLARWRPATTQGC